MLDAFDAGRANLDCRAVAPDEVHVALSADRHFGDAGVGAEPYSAGAQILLLQADAKIPCLPVAVTVVDQPVDAPSHHEGPGDDRRRADKRHQRGHDR